MNVKDAELIRCFGSTTVGPRGQAVIPISARKELGIEPGDTLLVFRGFRGQGLLLLKADTIETMLSSVSEKISNIEKQVKDYLPGGQTKRKK